MSLPLETGLLPFLCARANSHGRKLETGHRVGSCSDLRIRGAAAAAATETGAHICGGDAALRLNTPRANAGSGEWVGW